MSFSALDFCDQAGGSSVPSSSCSSASALVLWTVVGLCSAGAYTGARTKRAERGWARALVSSQIDESAEREQREGLGEAHPC